MRIFHVTGLGRGMKHDLLWTTTGFAVGGLVGALGHIMRIPPVIGGQMAAHALGGVICAVGLRAGGRPVWGFGLAFATLGFTLSVTLVSLQAEFSPPFIIAGCTFAYLLAGTLATRISGFGWGTGACAFGCAGLLGGLMICGVIVIANTSLNAIVAALVVTHVAGGLLLALLLRRRRGITRSQVGRCDKCGYDLRGQLDPRCPECGTPFAPGA